MPPLLWECARNVLCVRLDTLGDVVMTEPALRAVKAAVPGRRITLLTSESGAPAASIIDCVDDVMTYAAPWMKATPERFNSCPDRCFTRRLRRADFDAAVIFTCFSQSALPAAMLCYAADIPLRAAHCRENPYQLLTHWVHECEPQNGIRHEVERQLALAAAIGGSASDHRIRLTVPSAAVRNASRKLRWAGVDLASPWLVMHVGASAPSRRWPPEYFAEAADCLAERGAQIVFTGSTNEHELVGQVRLGMSMPSHSLVGQLDVVQLTGLLSVAPLLISNNTGPVHLAAGVGTPVVDIYALTNPQHVPWGCRSRVLSFDVPCKNCFRSVCPEEHHRCLRGVSPSDVVSAALDLLSAPPEPASLERIAG
jgi:lipopolysaccharide heptosyltransferase II